ncbi:hypothetical protein ACU4HD_12190 [Cupriavidus basilensis]
MSESTTPAQCRDADWNLARDCGLLCAAPGTNAWDAALGRFAETIRAARPADARAEALTDEQIAEQPARYSIDGVIAFGRMGFNKPEPGHWLMEYWSIGQQLAELGKTSSWDNQTPIATEQPKCRTCNGHGMIGGPSYYQPDEGGAPCPDCSDAPSEDKRDAARYRWLRERHWNESTLFVVAGHHSLVRLGTDCPSDERLDAAIDAAMSREQSQPEGDRA